MKTMISFMTHTEGSLQDHWCNRILYTVSQNSGPMATFRGSPTELRKHSSNINTRKKNSDTNVNNASDIKQTNDT